MKNQNDYRAGFRRGQQMIVAPANALIDNVIDVETAVAFYEHDRIATGIVGSEPVRPLGKAGREAFRHGYLAGEVCAMAGEIERGSRVDLSVETLRRLHVRLSECYQTVKNARL